MNAPYQLALSIRQPWAWLIVNRYKNIENRTWATRVRGTILIHAGAIMTEADYLACTLFISAMPGPWRLPDYKKLKQECGGFVGQAELIDCVTESNSPWFCGDYGFVFRAGKASPFKPAKGRLGFFRVAPRLLTTDH